MQPDFVIGLLTDVSLKQNKEISFLKTMFLYLKTSAKIVNPHEEL